MGTMKTTQMGARIIVNQKHAGMFGSTGRIVSKERIQGRTYYNVRLTGGRCRNELGRLLRTEFDVI